LPGCNSSVQTIINYLAPAYNIDRATNDNCR
jgi:hypothetical protein